MDVATTGIPADILATPVALPRGGVVPNRLFKSATTEGLADTRDNATDALCRLYERWSAGGAGLLFSGNVMIDRAHLERAGNVVLDEATDRAALKRWADSGKRHGSRFWMQISHPGRQCPKTVNPNPVSASDVQLHLGGGFGKPRPLTAQEVRAVISGFARAAAMAREAGFDGAQLHGAHGYLVSQFLSPVTNRRTDEWGGSLENRARLLLESLRAMRAAVGEDYPLSVKLNSADFRKGGFSLDDCVQVVRWLNELGLDLLEISGGSYEQPRLMGAIGDRKTYEPPRVASHREREAFFLDYAEAIRPVAQMPLAMTGGFRRRDTMVEAVGSGDVDLVGMARPFCADPDLPRKLMAGELTEAPRFQETIRLGPGLLGPQSPLQMARAMNMFGQMGWCYDQIVRMGQGKEIDFSLGAWRALVRYLRTDARSAKARAYRPG